MGFINNLFKKPKVDYQSTAEGAKTRENLGLALDKTTPTIGQTFQGDVTIDPSELISSTSGQIQNKINDPFRFNFDGAIPSAAFDTAKQNALEAFDVDTPGYLNPIIESQVANRLLPSGAGKNDILKAMTERKKQRADISSGFDLQKLGFLKDIQKGEQDIGEQAISNAFKFGGFEEARDIANKQNEMNLFFKNLGLPLEQAKDLAGILSVILGQEKAMTEIEASNAAARSPFNLMGQKFLSTAANVAGAGVGAKAVGSDLSTIYGG